MVSQGKGTCVMIVQHPGFYAVVSDPQGKLARINLESMKSFADKPGYKIVAIPLLEEKYWALPRIRGEGA